MKSMKTLTRVLVADDDQSIRQLLCTIVRREGIEVDCVPDGAEAIEQLEQKSYSVILLDLMMPRIDGFGVIEHLKQHVPAVKPLILVITAYADQKFKEVDPNIVAGVIRKPFEVSEIGNLVRLCVNGYEEATRDRLLSADDRAIRDIASRHWHIPNSRGANGSGEGAH